MRSDELKCMQVLDEKCSVSKWWMPLIWATNIIDQAREENRIRYIQSPTHPPPPLRPHSSKLIIKFALGADSTLTLPLLQAWVLRALQYSCKSEND